MRDRNDLEVHDLRRSLGTDAESSANGQDTCQGNDSPIDSHVLLAERDLSGGHIAR